MQAFKKQLHSSIFLDGDWCWDANPFCVTEESCHVKVISLTCDEASLQARLMQDIADGQRTADILERSTARLPLYQALDSVKLDTSGKSPEAVVKEIPAI